jgi:hypothetical protein
MSNSYVRTPSAQHALGEIAVLFGCILDNTSCPRVCEVGVPFMAMAMRSGEVGRLSAS